VAVCGFVYLISDLFNSLVSDLSNSIEEFLPAQPMIKTTAATIKVKKKDFDLNAPSPELYFFAVYYKLNSVDAKDIEGSRLAGE
jgi:hypothetical protein